ncbi:hypothetical protein [Dyella psychrodurans]|nr:hypothetical protein [Dyella psychrodurans]
MKLEVSLPRIDVDVAQERVDTVHRDIRPHSHATCGNVGVQIKLV